MKTLPLAAESFKIDAFSEWVEAQGFNRAAPTNEWEMVRYQSDSGWNIVYRTKKGRITWTGDARKHYLSFLNGGMQPKAKTLTSSQRKAIRKKLTKRDGCACWYCTEFFTDDDFATIEHLVPQSEGGGHQLANLVLAHKSCNQKADNAPLAHKIELRDGFLAALETTPPWESVRGLAGVER